MMQKGGKHFKDWRLVDQAKWWVKPQVYGSTEVVKREYCFNRELFNLINF